MIRVKQYAKPNCTYVGMERVDEQTIYVITPYKNQKVNNLFKSSSTKRFKNIHWDSKF